jgi:uncharacterized membrane protein
MISAALRFYRRRPLVGLAMLLVSLLLSLGIVLLGADQPVLAVVLMAILGIVFGMALSLAQQDDGRPPA